MRKGCVGVAWNMHMEGFYQLIRIVYMGMTRFGLGEHSWDIILVIVITDLIIGNAFY